MFHEDDPPMADVIALLRALSEDAEFFQDLGKTFAMHKKHALAKAAYDLSLQLDPCDGFTHLYLGNWYARGSWRPPWSDSSTPANSCPTFQRRSGCMADVFERQNRFEEAEALHRKAMAVDPNDKQARQEYRKYRRRRRQA